MRDYPGTVNLYVCHYVEQKCLSIMNNSQNYQSDLKIGPEVTSLKMYFYGKPFPFSKMTQSIQQIL